MPLPNYRGGSIVNLMASIMAARGVDQRIYPTLKLLPPQELREARKLVLFVIDGLGHAHLKQASPSGVLRRHLRGPITSVFPSTTASAITTFLTGTAPQQHGLTGWFTYFRGLDRVVTVLPFLDRVTNAPLTAEGIDARRLFDRPSAFTQMAARAYVVVPERIANSPYTLHHCAGAVIRPYRSMGRFFSAVKTILREGEGPAYIYAYWPELDHLAHEHGLASRSVSTHLAQLEAAFEGFLDAISGTRSAIIVSADHGIIDSGPSRLIEIEDHPELAGMLARPLCGERRAAFCYVHPEAHARFEAYVAKRLEAYTRLMRGADLIEGGYLGIGPAHPQLAERVGDYALLMREDYTIKDWVASEKRFHHIGTHGGLSPQEMYVPLVFIQT
jgi:hypothetical protein